MTNFNTELMSAFLKGDNLLEVMRKEVENTVNELLRLELTSFLDYERYDPIGYNSGNSRNGSYTRKLKTRFGEITVEIPRDRNGEFKQHTVPSYKRSTEDLESMIIQMYQRGITTSEISHLIERMFGMHYTPQTISNMTQVLSDQVHAFHTRCISSRYVSLYLDATYLSLRRDKVAKEAVHMIVGITDEGIKEILDYRLFPTESSENYKEMLLDLRERGLKEVLICVSDGLVGLREVCLEVFPHTKHQSCWVHISRRVGHLVRVKDRGTVLSDLKEVYQAKSKQEALVNLEEFKLKVGKHYPKVVQCLHNTAALLSFYDFPQSIQRSIYTTNLIENLNKQLKRNTKRKEQFPNEESLERFICSFFIQTNQMFLSRVHRGFNKSDYELNQAFS